jgi:HTH-type transcriptional regulator, quorum sensing regulator NprR
MPPRFFLWRIISCSIAGGVGGEYYTLTLLEQKASNLNVFDIKIDLALCYMELSREAEAISSLEEVVDQSLSKQQHHTALRALNALANVEKRRRKYHHAIYYWRKGCELFDHLVIPDPFLQGEILNKLGSIYLDLGETQEAIAYYQQANQLLSNTSNLDQIGQTYLGLASSYRRKEEPELASVYASYAVAMFETLKNLKLAIEVKREFALVNQNGKTRMDALQKLEECLAECKRYNFTDLCAAIYGDMAWVHLQLQDPLLSLEMAEEGLMIADTVSVQAATLQRIKGITLGELDMQHEAVQAFEEAIQLYESHSLNAEVANCYTLLAGLYQQCGDEKTANKYLILMRQVMQESLKERGLVFIA